jgi:hypothetical protein
MHVHYFADQLSGMGETVWLFVAAWIGLLSRLWCVLSSSGRSALLAYRALAVLPWLQLQALDSHSSFSCWPVFMRFNTRSCWIVQCSS